MLKKCLYILQLCALFYTPVIVAQQKHKAVYRDTVFQQAYSIKYEVDANANTTLQHLYCDRNGVVQIQSSKGILKPSGGAFLYPGKLVKDGYYPAMADKQITATSLYQQQFIYAGDKAVLSNAWAGKVFSPHHLAGAELLCGGNNFSFLLARGAALEYIINTGTVWEGASASPVLQLLFDDKRQLFWLLTANSIAIFDPTQKSIQAKYTGNALTCFELVNNELLVGTHNGLFRYNISSGKSSPLKNQLPCTDLTAIKQIGQQLWFGSAKGAFMQQANGKYKYYASKRWLPSDHVVDIAAGSDHTVLILTDKGLGAIHFKPTTLYDKALYFEQQVRQRHIRFGFNATLAKLSNGNIDAGALEDSDNDGLWTSMYLGAEAFRYASTHSPEALANCKESLDAIERLYSINSLKGFPARSFERRGYAVSDARSAASRDTSGPWKHAADKEWDWKSTTSSDEAIGHMFAFSVIAELIDVPAMKHTAIKLMDTLMQHIVTNNMYLVDWDGQPTRWGRWNPGYVNARPKMVGDRKIASSNIISMLQTAWHFTGRQLYKDKAFELMNTHGYLDNLMRPMKQIGMAPDTADELSKNLSDGWNHSDDEMYFLGYWGLYRYAFNPRLKQQFKRAILDHWQIERPEKEAAWNIATALTGATHTDLAEAIWYLQLYPTDMISWQVQNSDRKDISFMPPNFRNQTTTEVLPPDELPIQRHNANRFQLDGGDANGSEEYSAADIWLLPYWMGRYLDLITPPVKKD